MGRNLQNKVVLHIGIDDIDSPLGGCTTHLASILVESLDGRFSFKDYPNLIRLNPNIPWKTRGNGAVALRVLVEEDSVSQVVERVLDTVGGYVEEFMHPKRNPCVAFYTSNNVSRSLRWFGVKAIRDVITLDLVKKVVGRNGVKFECYEPGLRGLVGAVAAIGVPLDDCDYTYELLAYRCRENWGKTRLVEDESVFKMDEETRPHTFLNVDWEEKRVLITPRGVDPVLYGIRGEDPGILIKAMKMVKIGEPIERWTIFRSNQGTDMHLQRVPAISSIRVYQSVIVRGKVVSKPMWIKGGHVVFRIGDETGTIDVAAYEPTGLQHIASKLIPGDVIEASGGVRPASSKHDMTINLERLHIIKLAELVEKRNPKCPKCGKTMKSMGRNKGYRCPKCGFRTCKASKIIIVKKRDLETGTYYPRLRAYRHLMKPPTRIGREKRKPPTRIYTPFHGT